MGRGQAAEIGATRVAKNGYHYTKVGPDHPRAQNGWILTHWLTMEKILGRHLRADESVRFKVSGPSAKADPYNEDNVYVITKRAGSLRSRRAVLEDKIRDLQAELATINKELGD